jgi:SAM-dependent methyltransferase
VTRRCWVCGSTRLTRRREATVAGPLSAADFRITDAHYGRTAAIDACADCGFCQCTELADVLPFYEALDDPSYDESGPVRGRRMNDLLATLARWKAAGRLVDVGAGSGVLVREAQRRGYQAEGVDPSRRLCERAAAKGARVHLGVLPHPALTPPYDAATLIDVIEHVADPVALLTNVRDLLARDGVGVVVTPDLDSLAARAAGARWWHFRVAHIGYFNRASLLRALDRAGLVPLKLLRPGWHFKVGYLADHAPIYLPFLRRWRPPAGLRERIVRLNLLDSWLVVFCRK